MPLDFTAIDFETANSSAASPCAVGLVRVRAGKVVATFSTLIQPPADNNWFSPFNIKVHGIYPDDIVDAPTWAQALEQMIEFIGDDILVAHNAGFDMGVLQESAALIEAKLPSWRYACSVMISRKTYNIESHRLNHVAYVIGIEEFNHHDALADAEVCARIIIHAADRHGVETLDELAEATKHQIKTIGQKGNVPGR